MTEEKITPSKVNNTDATAQNERLSKTILSPQEVESVVRSFILSWLRGTIEISFPTTSEVEENKKPRHAGIALYPTGYDPKRDAANIRANFVGLVEICTGSKAATFQEQEKALQDLFAFLMMLRATLRIRGTFTPFDVETQLDNMQVKIDAINKVVNEIVNHLREEAKA